MMDLSSKTVNNFIFDSFVEIWKQQHCIEVALVTCNFLYLSDNLFWKKLYLLQLNENFKST